MKTIYRVLSGLIVLTILLAIGAFVLFGKFPSQECRKYNFEKRDLIIKGTKANPTLVEVNESLLEFPPLDNIFRGKLPVGKQVSIRDFTLVKECEIASYALHIRIVRFKVNEPEIFSDTRSEDIGIGKIMSGGILPWKLNQENKAAGFTILWPISRLIAEQEKFSADYSGMDTKYPRVNKILTDVFKNDWPKEEPLGEKEFMGLWRGGWLFRSKNLGEYVWIG